MLPSSHPPSRSKGKSSRRQSVVWVLPWVIALLSLSFSTFQFLHCHGPDHAPSSSEAAPSASHVTEDTSRYLQEKKINDLNRKVKGLQMTVELLSDALGALNASHLKPTVTVHSTRHSDERPNAPSLPPPAEHDPAKSVPPKNAPADDAVAGAVTIDRKTQKHLANSKRSMMRDVKSSCVVRVDGRAPKVTDIDKMFSVYDEVDIPAHDISSIDARTLEECLAYCLCREELLVSLDERIHGDTSTKHRDIDTQNALKGEVEEWAACLGVTYLRAQWECWLKTANDRKMAKQARGDKKINGIAVKAPQLQTALLKLPEEPA